MEPLIFVAIGIAAAALGSRFGVDSRRDEPTWPAAVRNGCTPNADYYRSEWRPRDV